MTKVKTPRCPKCTSNFTRIIEEYDGWYLRCSCGLVKLLESKLADIEDVKIDFGGKFSEYDENNLDHFPTMCEGTAIHKTLQAVANLSNADGTKKTNTLEVTRWLMDNWDVVNLPTNYGELSNYVATNLSILRNRECVIKGCVRKGTLGGSDWNISRFGVLILKHKVRQGKVRNTRYNSDNCMSLSDTLNIVLEAIGTQEKATTTSDIVSFMGRKGIKVSPENVAHYLRRLSWIEKIHVVGKDHKRRNLWQMTQ